MIEQQKSSEYVTNKLQIYCICFEMRRKNSHVVVWSVSSALLSNQEAFQDAEGKFKESLISVYFNLKCCC